MTGAEHSLLSFLDAPVIVGDPEGNAAYVNPTFEERFELSGEGVLGRPLAEIFEGGGREAILRAVAEVCQFGESVRFRVRERGVGFAAVASPIVAQDARVGVVILLKEEVEGVERLLALQREIQDPVDELGAALEQLQEGSGGAEGQRLQLDEALRCVSRIRKWMEQVNAVLCGAPNPSAERESVDPAALVRNVMRRVSRDADHAQVQIDLLAAASLPTLRADPTQLEAILMRLVRDRIEQGRELTRILLSARAVTASEGAGRVLLAITERSAQGGFGEAFSPPPLAKEVVASCGGSIHVSADPVLGRSTLISLPVAPLAEGGAEAHRSES